MYNAGDFNTTETVKLPFNTFSSDDPSASVTITNLVAGDVEIHKDGSTTQRNSDNGVTVSINFDGVTGNHIVSIDLSDNSDAGFYSSGSRYLVRIEGTTIDGGTVNGWIGGFSIGCTLRPSVDGRTLGVESDGDLTKVNALDGHTAQTGDSFTRIGANGAALSGIPWNSSWDTEVESECTDALNAYDPPTKAEMDTAHGLLATEAKQDIIDGIVDDILVDTGTTIPAQISGLNDLSAAEVNAECDTALQDIHLDHLLAADYNPASKPGVATALLNEIIEDDVGVSRLTANALEEAPTGGSAPTVEEIADGVWDEAKAGHVGAGTFGEEVQSHATPTEVNSQCDTALSDYDAPTRAELTSDKNEIITEVDANETKIDTVDTVVDAIKLVTDNLPDSGALNDLATLLTRLTAARAGYLDNLNIGENVAGTSEAAAIKAHVTGHIHLSASSFIVPASGSNTYRVEFFHYDSEGNMEAPDAAPTISVDNQAGTSRNANLSATTMSLVAAGRYRVTYTVDNAHAIEQLNFTVSCTEGSATKLYGAAIIASDDQSKIAGLYSALLTTHAELGSIPAADASSLDKLELLFMALKNKYTSTNAQADIHNDAEASIGSASLSDAAGTLTKGEFS